MERTIRDSIFGKNGNKRKRFVRILEFRIKI